MSPLRQRKISESCLDTTSVGRVRTHSGCNPNMSPFHSPFSPPMSPYQVQPSLYNISQENKSSPKVLDKRKQDIESEDINNSKQSELSQGAKNS